MTLLKIKLIPKITNLRGGIFVDMIINGAIIDTLIYTSKNFYRENSYKLGSKLADQIYNSVSECGMDICNIVENLNFKVDNIQNIKDHIFYTDLERGLASKHSKTKTYTQHECTVGHPELKYD